MAIKSKPFLLRGIVKIQCFLKCFIARWPFGKEGGSGKMKAWHGDKMARTPLSQALSPGPIFSPSAPFSFA